MTLDQEDLDTALSDYLVDRGLVVVRDLVDDPEGYEVGAWKTPMGELALRCCPVDECA